MKEKKYLVMFFAVVAGIVIASVYFFKFRRIEDILYKGCDYKLVSISDDEEGYCLYNCRNDRSQIIIPERIRGYLTVEIGDYAFIGCGQVKHIEVPDSIKRFGHGVFSGCNSLETIVLPKEVEGPLWELFQGCSSLKEIILPENIDGITAEMFKGCTSLKVISIPESVEKIGAMAFQNCTLLEEIVIPKNVTVIGDYAFENCTSLKNVWISKESEIAISETAFRNSSAVISQR